MSGKGAVFKENGTLSLYHGCNWMSLNTDSLTDDHHRLTHHSFTWFFRIELVYPTHFPSISKFFSHVLDLAVSSHFPGNLCYFFGEFALKFSSIHPSHLLDLQKWNLQWGSAPWLLAASSWSEGLWPAATATWPAVGVAIWWDLGCCSGICFGVSYGVILYKWNMYDMRMIWLYMICLFIDIDIYICENDL